MRAAASKLSEAFRGARTHAVVVEGEDVALEWCAAYAEAGADLLFPEALGSAAQFRKFGTELSGVPLVANMTECGKSPLFSAVGLHALGFAVALFPVAAVRTAQDAVVRPLGLLRRTDTQPAMLGDMLPGHELYDLVGLDDVGAWEERFGSPGRSAA